MIRTFAIALMITAAALLLGCASAGPFVTRRIAPPAAAAIAPLPPDDVLNIPLVLLDGTPAEMGAAHGQALGERIKYLQTSYLEPFLQRAGATRKVMALAAATLFERYISSEHRDEIDALSASSGLDPRMTMLAQCFLDLTVTVACSSASLPASASPDGVPRLARNLDFPSLGVLEDQSCVLVYRPTDGRYQFAAIGWPGMTGVLSAMNEHGLVLCNMEVKRAPRLPQAMPYALLYRTVIERCRNVSEAIAMLQSMPRQSANNVILMDAAGDRAVVELTPESVIVRRAADDHSALLSTNHQRGQDTTTVGRCWRYDLMHETTTKQFGTMGVEQLEQMLAAAAQDNFTLQSMVFEPSTRVIYLATGADAPKKHFYRIDLKRHFRVEREW